MHLSGQYIGQVLSCKAGLRTAGVWMYQRQLGLGGSEGRQERLPCKDGTYSPLGWGRTCLLYRIPVSREHLLVNA